MGVAGTYNPALVVLSIIIAIVASFTALDLAARVRDASGLPRYAWLLAAAAAMGGGIWSMHFVAMLAFQMPMPMSYDIGITTISLLMPMVATGTAFFVVSRRSGGVAIAASGVFMGAAIVAMHYTGMAAMRMPADIDYEPLLVGASVVIAVGASTVALWLAFRRLGPIERVAAAPAMGIAIAGMHYTGMAAASFNMRAAAHDMAAHASLDQTKLAAAIASITFTILFLALIAALFDRRFALLAEREATALRREKEFSDLLINNAAEGILAYDTALRYTLWNPAMAAMTGVPAEEALGRICFDLFPFLAETPAGAAIRGALAGETASIADIPYKVGPTGRQGFYDAHYAPLRAADGAIVGAIAFVRETTQRREMEEALRQAQKMEAVGQLTGGVAHDFNNLLTVIGGNLDLLQHRLSTVEPGVRGALEGAMRGVARAASVTQRLLAFSRRQPLQPQIVDLNKLVAGMSELIRRSLGENIAIETRLAGGLWRTHVDPNQLEAALLNLAVNARDAMPEGGRLTIATDNADLEPGAGDRHEVTPGQYVVVALSDTGTGMSPEIRARAFEPFYTTKEIGKGSGLGLSQVYGFVKQSGGHTEIASAPGRGTTIKLYLPRSTAAREVVEAPAPELRTARPRETVLLVEDDEDVRAYGVQALERLGYRVREAADGRAALAIIDSVDDIDLLFTDVGLPGMNGRALADEVRRRRPTLPVLFTTGYAKDAIVHKGTVDEGIHLIGKPWSIAALGQKIREVLEQEPEAA